jgi:hypothetical protein
MGGYTDKNFILKIEDQGEFNRKHPIKISSTLEKKSLIHLQNFVLKQLEKNGFQFQCLFPKIIPTVNN